MEAVGSVASTRPIIIQVQRQKKDRAIPRMRKTKRVSLRFNMVSSTKLYIFKPVKLNFRVDNKN